MRLFWIFRKRRPIKSTAFYLDCAAGILQARGKATGQTIDGMGRVDVTGALRIAVYGTANSDEMSKVHQRRNGFRFWEAYSDAKVELAKCLIGSHPEYAGRFVTSTTGLLHKWSDQAPQEELVAWLRKAAKQ